MADDFHDVRFPTHISFGATGGPERRTEIVALTSGREHRNQRFAHSRRRYDVGTGIRSAADLQEIVAFFEARRGAFHGFRFRDPFDMKSCAAGAEPSAFDQEIGIGDGQAQVFQLAKSYGEGGEAYRRDIRTPVATSVVVAVGSSVLGGDALGVDAVKGEVTFAEPPPPGLSVTAGFVFDVPVRFDIDHLAVSMSAFAAGQIPSILLVEIEP